MESTVEAPAEVLRINDAVVAAENVGDRTFFEEHLAPVFSMRRRPGLVIDRGAYLDALAPGGRRTVVANTTRPLFVDDHRVLIETVVEVPGEKGPERTHNVRVFARAPEGSWKLLCWVNEPATGD